MSQPSPPGGIKQVVLWALEEAYRHEAWHGPNLGAATQGLSVEEAQWRPASTRHNIWELVLHCAYWTQAVRCRISGDRFVFPEEGENWFTRPEESSEAALERDLQLLDQAHSELLETLEQVSPEAFPEAVKTGRGSVLGNALGIAFHHVYHAGQIQLLKKLRAGAG